MSFKQNHPYYSLGLFRTCFENKWFIYLKQEKPKFKWIKYRKK